MITPLGKNYLLLKMKEEEVKKGSLLLPNEKPNQIKALVVDFGNKCEEKISVGSIVLLPPYSGKTIQDDDKEYILIHEEMLLGIWRDK
jgi:co-chaperonin GroES (HSP10)